MLAPNTSTPLPTSQRGGGSGGANGTADAQLSPVERLANVQGGELVVPLKRKLFALFVLCVVDLWRAYRLWSVPPTQTHAPQLMIAAQPYVTLGVPLLLCGGLLLRRIVHVRTRDFVFITASAMVSFVFDTVWCALAERWADMALALGLKCALVSWTIVLVLGLVGLPTFGQSRADAAADDAAAKVFQFVVSVIPFWGPVVSLMLAGRMRRRE